MPGNDRSRLVDESGSDKTIAAVDTIIRPTADFPEGLDLTPSLMARWRRAAYAAIATLARSGEQFTSDSVVVLVGRPPRGRQLSSALAVARRRRLIRPVGATFGREGGLLRVWVGWSE